MEHTDEQFQQWLNKLREKLLDLTGRNRLIHYRHSTRNSLRIINELPNNIFERLVVTSKPFRFLPNDPEGKLLDQGNSLSQESISLPSPDQVDADNWRYIDDKLQTDRTHDALDAVLKRIRTQARSAIEETGVNLLYLTIGFLEWYESDDSQEPRFSPLILIPVHLDRELLRNHYEYSLNHTGEEVQTNMCLAKRLEDDFHLKLPEFEDGQSLEKYFEAVNAVVYDQPRWKIRREAYLDFFSFRKFQMYLDLDSSRWPQDRPLNTNSKLIALWQGQQAEPITRRFAADYHLDDNELADQIILADDADSSQHSALMDIASGQDMVIEGPPGTGKSQTITNAIAHALHEGKTVLFVAEKLAALTVVRKRLAAMGLNDFCVELHSEAAKPKAVYKDLARRLSAEFTQPTTLAGKRHDLIGYRKELLDYLDAVNQRVGPRHEPLYKVFGRITECRTRGVEGLPNVQVQVPPDSASFEQRLNYFDELYQHIQEIGAPRSHPWRGLNVATLTESDRVKVQDAVCEWRKAADKLRDTERRLRELTELDGVNWVKVTARHSGKPWSVLVAEPWPDPHLCARLTTSQRCQAAEKLADQLIAYHAAAKQADASVVYGIPEAEAVASELCASLKQLKAVLGEPKLTHLRALAATLQQLQSVITEIETYTQALQSLGYGDLPHQAALEDALKRYKLMQYPVTQRPEGWCAELFLHATEQRFIEARKQNEELEVQCEQLATVFSLRDLPGVEIIDQTRKTLRAHAQNRWRWFSKVYRDARRALKLFLQPRAPRKLADQVEQLDRLVSYLDARKSFKENQTLQLALGPTFRGFETDWPYLLDLLRWAKTARELGLSYQAAKQLLDTYRKAESPPEHTRIRSINETMQKEVETPLLKRWLQHDQMISEHTRYETLRNWIKDRHRELCGNLELLPQFRITDDQALDQIIECVGHVVEAEKRRNELDHSVQYRHLLGNSYAGSATSFDKLRGATQWMADVLTLNLPASTYDWLLTGSLPTKAGSLHEGLVQLSQAVEVWNHGLAAMKEFAAVDESWDTLLDDDGPRDDPSYLRRVRELSHAMDAMLPWASFCRCLRRGGNLGLELMVNAVFRGDLDAVGARDCYEFMVNQEIATQQIKDNPVLADFSRQRHETTRKRFQELDREIVELNRQEIATKANQRSRPMGQRGSRVGDLTEMYLVNHVSATPGARCKIRQLLARAGGAIQSLKPCFMMSPLSVAQYLPSNSIDFDLVIMDEASQIKPEDALGAIARAKQVVIVGDQKQLPPTSFFDKLNDDDTVDDDDLTVTDDAESILDAGARVYPSRRRLRWHYRSLHETLIAFSNERFYDGELIVFPSPTTDNGRLGLRFHPVVDGRFSQGLNPVEAEQVAQAIARHAVEHPDETLGVGTFNIKQKELIDECLDKISTADPYKGEAIERLKQQQESLFIKNLENLQGDERDVIFISYTYGPDPATGRPYQRFGPITGENGWRRLNVLVTRARNRVEVFSSMEPGDILGGPAKSLGVNALRDYLQYVKTGVLVDRGIVTDREPDSPFEIAVARVVRQMGLDVVHQVGVAGYYVDLGVLQPGNNGDYLLGIECDGATYHSGKSARDRDRLREQIIQARGWKLHRIWSTDWFYNQQAEIKRLHDTLRQLI